LVRHVEGELRAADKRIVGADQAFALARRQHDAFEGPILEKRGHRFLWKRRPKLIPKRYLFLFFKID
jgi:hypothetical protein